MKPFRFSSKARRDQFLSIPTDGWVGYATMVARGITKHEVLCRWVENGWLEQRAIPGSNPRGGPPKKEYRRLVELPEPQKRVRLRRPRITKPARPARPVGERGVWKPRRLRISARPEHLAQLDALWGHLAEQWPPLRMRQPEAIGG